MDKKLVIGLSTLAIATVSCYIAILSNNTAQMKDLDNVIVYDETTMTKIIIHSGVNSTTWEEYNPYVYSQEGLGEADKIDQLPGQPEVSFAQYSGFVTVDGQTKREVFYYFAESPESPTTRPLVLWLTGEDGSSSLIQAMTGLGPYRVLNDSATLGLNPYAWNNVANILFLDTPIGAGFSYSDTKSDYDLVGDKMIAQDSYTFLVNWLERFPGYKNREFYIAGDTIAGRFVSQLSKIILHMNKKANSTTVIELRGILVENAVLDEPCTSFGTLDFLYKRKVISENLMQTLKVCDYSNRIESLGVANPIKCNVAETKFQEKLESPILRDLPNPPCILSSTPQPISTKNWTFDPMRFDPCTEPYMTTYMDNDQVRKALHAKTIKWSMMSESISEWKDQEVTVLLTVKELMASGIRVWFYSGENYGAQPEETIECAIKALKLEVKYQMYAWYNAPTEVGGFVFEYHNMTFVTVKGLANHISSYAPAKALTIFSSFLEGKFQRSTS